MAEPVIVVMGVSGCGKSIIGARLARRLGLPFAEGDDFHPTANVQKMAAGVPLTDDDRWPWLAIVGAWLGDHRTGGVVACSALREVYRDVLREAAPAAYFVHLAASREELLRRLSGRHGHFMPATLLDSQLATLEPLRPGEAGITLDAVQPPDRLVEEAVSAWEATHR